MNDNISKFGEILAENRKIAVFADGYNLHRNIEKFEDSLIPKMFLSESRACSSKKPGAHLKHRALWYRLDKIVACCLGIAGNDDALDSLIESDNLFINFYTAEPRDKDWRYDIDDYYKPWTNLQGNLGVNVVESYFLGPLDPGGYFKEKETDVKLALDMVRGADDGLYDTVIVISNDNDFKPAIREINKMDGKRSLAIRLSENNFSERKNDRGIDIYSLSFNDFKRYCLEADRVDFDSPPTQNFIKILSNLQGEVSLGQRYAKKLKQIQLASQD